MTMTEFREPDGNYASLEGLFKIAYHLRPTRLLSLGRYVTFSSNASKVSLLNLQSKDLYLLISQFLPFLDVIHFSQTCKQLRHLDTGNKSLWKSYAKSRYIPVEDESESRTEVECKESQKENKTENKTENIEEQKASQNKTKEVKKNIRTKVIEYHATEVMVFYQKVSKKYSLTDSKEFVINKDECIIQQALKIRTLMISSSGITYGLRSLELSKQNMVSLPSEIGLMVNLEYLSLCANRLRRLPSTIGKLKKLNFFAASHNKIKYLPVDIGELKCLWCLDLSENYLVELPTTVAKMQGITSLSLADNNLTELPMDLLKLTKLMYIDVSKNPLKTTAEQTALKERLMEILKENAPPPLPDWAKWD